MANKLEKQLGQEWYKYGQSVEEIANKEFERVVKPWLIKNKYKFSAGMGACCVYNKFGNQIPRHMIPLFISSVIFTEAYGFNQNLGSLMSDFDGSI